MEYKPDESDIDSGEEFYRKVLPSPSERGRG